MPKEKMKNQKNKQDAESKATLPAKKKSFQIVEIPIYQLELSDEDKGIRDKEQYERTKDSIEAIGLNDPLNVFPVGDKKYKVSCGNHRLRILKELRWQKVPCIIEDKTKEEAFISGIADNICRSNYSAIQKEEIVFEATQKPSFKKNEELGRQIGLSKAHIGKLLKGYQLRKEINEKAKKIFTLPTDVICDTEPIKDIDNRIKLLNLVEKKKIMRKDVRRIAELCQDDLKLGNQILAGTVNFYLIKSDLRRRVKSSLNKSRRKNGSYTSYDIEPFKNIYDAIVAVGKQLKLLDEGKEKKRAVDYCKVSATVLLESLQQKGEISKEDFEHLKKDVLGINLDKLESYDGSLLKNNLNYYFQGGN